MIAIAFQFHIATAKELIRSSCTGKGGTFANRVRLLRDTVLFQERIIVLVEQKFRAMRLEIGEDDAFWGRAKLEVRRTAGTALDPGLPDMRRDLLRQVHDDSLCR
jgi:hypothetical protein